MAHCHLKLRTTVDHLFTVLSIENMEQDTWIDGVNGLFALREISKRNPSLINNSARGFHNGFGAPHIRKLYLKALQT